MGVFPSTQNLSSFQYWISICHLETQPFHLYPDICANVVLITRVLTWSQDPSKEFELEWRLPKKKNDIDHRASGLWVLRIPGLHLPREQLFGRVTETVTRSVICTHIVTTRSDLEV